MPRIDVRRRGVAGVYANETAPSHVATPGTLGIDAVAGELERRRQISEQKRLETERNEDAIANAELVSGFRADAAKHLDQRADAFDGTGDGPFAENLELEFDDMIEQRLADLPQRRLADAKLRLVNERGRLALAAYEIEDKKRETANYSRLASSVENETNAILSDPSHYPTARDNLESLASAAPPALRAKLIEDSRAAYASAYGEARMDADPEGYLDELNSGALDAELDPRVKASHLSGARAEIDRRRREAERAEEKKIAKANNAVETELKAMEKSVTLGLPVSNDRLDKLAAVAASADEATRAAYAETANIIRAAAQIQDAPPAAGEAIIAEERARLHAKGDASGFEARRVEFLEKTLSGMETRLDQDFAGFLADRGEIEPLAIEGLSAEALAERQAIVEERADYYGAPAQYFTEAERRSFSRLAPGSPEMISLATQIAANGRGRAMLAELAPKSPELAHFGGLLAGGGDAGFVEDASAGAAAKASEGFDSSLPPSASGTSIADRVDTVYGAAFAASPETARLARHAAELAYEGRSQRLGRTKDEFDNDAFTRTLQEAAGGRYIGRNDVLYGGVVSLGKGKKVVAPSWMRNDNFYAEWRRLNAKDFQNAGGEAFYYGGDKLKPVDMGALRQGTPVAVGDGEYFIAFGDPGSQDPQWALDKDGAPYRLDLNKLRGQIENPTPITPGPHGNF